VNELKRRALIAAMAAALALPAEGVRRVAYYDPPGILTVCRGHTGPDVVKNKVYSPAECDKFLTDDMRKAVDAVERCAPGLPPNVAASFADAVFNGGPRIACDTKTSTAARLLAAGRIDRSVPSASAVEQGSCRRRAGGAAWADEAHVAAAGAVPDRRGAGVIGVQGAVEVVLAVALVAGGALGVRHYNESLREEGRAEIREKDRAAMQAQADRNRDLQRAAEIRYTVTAATRDRFITKTITEVRYATAALAACPVGPDAVRLFNRAAGCARDDSPASCGADQPVSSAR
jgi:lysozyme